MHLRARAQTHFAFITSLRNARWCITDMWSDEVFYKKKMIHAAI